MKRITSMTLLLSLCLSLAACGQKPAAPESQVPALTEAAATEIAAVMPTETEVREQTIEITMDNWQEYFELRPAADPRKDENGTLQSIDFCYGVFLKPQYMERFVSGQVDFEILFDLEQHPVEVNWEEGTYTLEEKIPTDLESSVQQKTFSMEDLRNREDFSADSDFSGTVAGFVYGGTTMEQEDGSFLAEVPENGEILHAEGSLTFTE